MGPPLASFWEQLTPGGAYVRCKLPARHLPGRSMGFEPKDLRAGKDGEPVFPRQAGNVAVWQFVGSRERAIPMAAMQDLGVKILMEVDDNYLRPLPFGGDTWTVHHEPGKNSYEAHRATTLFCDGVICATPYLADLYREVNENVYVCRNAVDPADWKEPQPFGDTLRIGWAASDSHLVDAPLVRRALRWASKQKDVQVILQGNLFSHLRHNEDWRFPFHWVPWRNSLEDYRHNLGFLDVALCPLKDSGWSRGKSDLKALEAAMGGALPVVSRTEAYRPWWEENRPCLVAESAGGFEEAVRWCLTNREKTRRLATEARAYVLKERSYPDAVQPWRDTVNAVTALEPVCA